jgi:hypothetical protein
MRKAMAVVPSQLILMRGTPVFACPLCWPHNVDVSFSFALTTINQFERQFTEKWMATEYLRHYGVSAGAKAPYLRVNSGIARHRTIEAHQTAGLRP